MRSLTQALAARCAEDLGASLSTMERSAMHDIVRTAFIDTAACILAGRDDPATVAVTRWLAARAGASDATCTALFDGPRLPAAESALLNAVAGHALDYDDVGLAGHPSVVLVPVLLAEHERSGTRGFGLVQAYAKGYAVWAELQRRLDTSLHARGWHPTAVLGTVAAAAAAAAARSLGAEETARALGIAASLASGVVANFGSMTKPLQVGRAAQSGVHAVEWAAGGVDASPDALDGPAGLLCALVGRASVVPADDVGDFMTVLAQRPGIKKYPVCYAAHRVVDGVLDLAAAHGVRSADVTAARAAVSRTAAGVLRHHAPRTLTEARFSLEFAMAAALHHGRLGLREVTTQTLQEPAVAALMSRIAIEQVDTSCPLEPSFALTDEVELSLTDGRTLRSGPIRFARGHAELPLREAELMAKLAGCAPGGSESMVRAVLHGIDAALSE